MNRSSGMAGPREYGVGQPSVQIEHRMLKSKRRRLLAIVVLTELILWIGFSALVTWMFTRRSSAPFPEPTPQVAWANVEAHRLETPVFLPVAPEQLSPYDHIRDIPESVPVVFVTGSADRHAHLDEVTAMHHRIESHAKLVIFDGAQHADLDRANPELYRKTLLSFLDIAEMKRTIEACPKEERLSKSLK